MERDKINQCSTSLIHSQARLCFILSSHLYKVQPTALWKWQRYCFISSAPYNQYPLPAATDEPISYWTIGRSNIKRVPFNEKEWRYQICMFKMRICWVVKTTSLRFNFWSFQAPCNIFNISLKWLWISKPVSAQGEGKRSKNVMHWRFVLFIGRVWLPLSQKCDWLWLRG